jgi:hypothetical protein
MLMETTAMSSNPTQDLRKGLAELITQVILADRGEAADPLPAISTPVDAPATPVTDDLLIGAEAIAQHLGKPWDKPPYRKVYYDAARGNLPVDHMGGHLVARKSRLDRIGLGNAA